MATDCISTPPPRAITAGEPSQGIAPYDLYPVLCLDQLQRRRGVELHEELWLSYSHTKPYRGMTYPLGQRHASECLRRANVKIGSLSLALPAPECWKSAHSWGPLIGIYWPGDYHWMGHRSTRSSHVSMTVYAVPADRSQLVRGLLLHEGLAMVEHWLAKIERRSEVWQYMEHHYLLSFRDEEDGLVTTET